LSILLATDFFLDEILGGNGTGMGLDWIGLIDWLDGLFDWLD
jgi:hypothetical protein